MEAQQVRLFLEKFAAGSNTESEHQQFIDWLQTAPQTEVQFILEEYEAIAAEKSIYTKVDPLLVERIEAALDQPAQLQQLTVNRSKIIPWRSAFKIAASVLILLSGIAVYFFFNQQKPVPVATVTPKKEKQAGAPGSNKAILTLSDGSTIALDDAKNGQLAQQAGAAISKLANGQLVYNATGNKSAEIVYNTLTTPAGGQFKLTLPDGSEVWLNAVSSIKYPTVFAGNERKVEITGEAYFEIAHDASKPFKVNVNGMEVKVLGTHFNVNAYDDETAVKTTLLQGSVSLSKSGSAVMLQPGQQGQVNNSSSIKVVKDVDVEQVVAWKNGYFSFNRADLQTVMRQIARWYDMQIVYEGKISERVFGGKIDRNSNLSEVLKILEESKIHFKVEQSKIIVKQ